MAYNYNSNNPALFEDVRQLCICNAKAISELSKKHNEDPRLITKLFLEIFKLILNNVDKETK